GGRYSEFGNGITVGPDGTAYAAGETGSDDFPTTPGAFDQTFNGGNFDVFLTHVNAAGTALVSSTYVGGRTEDIGYAVALDPSGNAYLTGSTNSVNYPTTPGAY